MGIEDLMSTERKNTLVLFDLGAVLLRLNFTAFFDKAAQIARMSTEEFKNAYVKSNIEVDAMTGDLTEEEFLRNLNGLLGADKNLTDDELSGLFGLALGEPVQEMIDLKRRVYENGYSVGILSNTMPTVFKLVAKQNNDIFRVYDKESPMILSYNAGAIKPNPDIYKEIRGFGKVIFIDDKESYLKVGYELFGWNAILYTPLVDPAETVRSLPGHAVQLPKTEDIKVADNIGEVEEALKYFGVHLR